jgi:Cu-Zn family superoxide dismutase
VSGFLTNGGQSLIGRPAGLVVAADGALLISDDANGAIYRVAYGAGQVNSGDNTGSRGNASSVQVTMRDIDGRSLGVLTVSETATGLDITGTLRGLSRGTHGIHIHQVGQCVAPFTSAGAHWNPTQRQHGTDNPQGAHTGDLPNINVGANGSAVVRLSTQGGTLYGASQRSTGGRLGRSGGLTVSPLALIDADGAAIVVHAEADDYRSDPSGNSGARVACGVISGR